MEETLGFEALNVVSSFGLETGESTMLTMYLLASSGRVMRELRGSTAGRRGRVSGIIDKVAGCGWPCRLEAV